MLSYQHAYHAGNLADLQKHGALAWTLAYLTRKDKPLSYIETHAGRGLYDLSGAEATKTGEAAQGIEAHADWFGPDHPLSQARAAVIAAHGPQTYPGSPAIAAHLLRPGDSLHLAELHPGEHGALREGFRRQAKLYRQDGFELAHALTPPTPRRGLLLIDPPYEIKDDYADIPRHIGKIAKAWNVGIIMLWYPVLTSGAHEDMLARLMRAHPEALRHEVRFPPARPGHGMVGSGLFVLNPPFGLEEELRRLSTLFAKLNR
ncbi:23S rRNA (adenine(2030)-N(6))-methyltransferase RlmJ [Aliishimia ponticola]|uniref:Ribosomal RNA large subunit methyltransferase J n=1 Tax=Aliishimia ponticola TaxID=2499833 RepID=A0A4S4NBA7_9RHOB|nr:23S rRNA (adenine(2030)-N(6))-methyltransferase RlmJ [Aliishimia ponticola]THH35747.1 23S rRNA (adenine(2030)-N(6))-methyltransferase RlmJ [Aliishimia ponticola]